MLPKTNIGTPIILTVFLLIACAGVSQQVPLETLVQEADSRLPCPLESPQNGFDPKFSPTVSQPALDIRIPKALS